ncbi:MAG TPA: DUF3175 domain-containing protein [Stellaceae bacterium]
MAATAKRKRTAKATRSPAKRKAKRKAHGKYWSAGVMQRSDALDLKSRVFTWRDPTRIARSLKQSAEHSKRRKAGPYQSAMSMLNFYLNRGGRNLPAERKRVLTRAKAELRRLFGRD